MIRGFAGARGVAAAWTVTVVAVAMIPRAADARVEPAQSRGESTVTVYAAASVREPFAELGTMLSARLPGVRVAFSFAGSNALAVQIAHGAPADVFASADMQWMRYVRDSAHAVDSSRVFARNRLVVVTPSANPGRITRLQDLARPGLKIVVGADAVPVGRYARDAITRLAAAPEFPAGYAGSVQRNVVSREENVAAVVTKVRLGEADAGIVYASDASGGAARELRVIEVPEAYNVLAEYTIAVLTASRNATNARAFVDLVLSPDGQAVLARHGFAPARR